MKAPVQFFFDFSSPYSYIASEWIEALAARHGRAVQWHAILLGVTFQAAELRSPVHYPIKREYTFPRLRALGPFRRRALPTARSVSDPHAECRARVLVAG